MNESTGSGSGSRTSGDDSGSGSSGATSPGSGSTAGSGNSSGEAGVSDPTGCTWGANYTGATFTEYTLGQGTEPETACGYFGTGTNTGSTYDEVDTVTNIANSGAAKNTYFAAMPSDTSGNWPYSNCGACVVITGQHGAKVIATLIDECPTTDPNNKPCTEKNHLDLSSQAFDQTEVAAGSPNNGGDLPGSWHFIACPITADIVTLFNHGYKGQIYIQNMVYPVASGSVASGSASGTPLVQSKNNYWSAAGISDFSNVSVKLTDVLGHTITGKVSATDGGSFGAQFPSPGNCPVQ